jgi:hypothetical protein
MTGERAPRQLAAVSADLLDQGAIIDRLSRPLTIAALLGLIVGLGIELGALLTAGLLLVSLAGLVETYLALRVGFTALFRWLAERGLLARPIRLLRCGADRARVAAAEQGRTCRRAARALDARRMLTLQERHFSSGSRSFCSRPPLFRRSELNERASLGQLAGFFGQHDRCRHGS